LVKWTLQDQITIAFDYDAILDMAFLPHYHNKSESKWFESKAMACYDIPVKLGKISPSRWFSAVLPFSEFYVFFHLPGGWFFNIFIMM
jgi:hypothetical protein